MPGGNLRIIRRCWYNICFMLRPFLSKRCSWHYPFLAHCLKEIKSAACTRANGKGVGSRTISPSSSLNSLCDPGPGHVPSASLHSGRNLSDCQLQQCHRSIQAVWLHTCIFTAKAAVWFCYCKSRLEKLSKTQFGVLESRHSLLQCWAHTWVILQRWVHPSLAGSGCIFSILMHIYSFSRKLFTYSWDFQELIMVSAF